QQKFQSYMLGQGPRQAGFLERAQQAEAAKPYLLPAFDRTSAAGELAYRQTRRLLPAQRELAKAERERAVSTKELTAAQQQLVAIEQRGLKLEAERAALWE